MAAPEKNIALVDRACVMALSWFRSDNIRLLSLGGYGHGVQAITRVLSATLQDERTKYEITLQCGCSRDLAVAA